MNPQPTERATDQQYRVLIVRDPAGKRTKRWRWSVEREGRDGWELVYGGLGTAWTRIGATDKATRRVDRDTGWFDARREEWSVTVSGTYSPVKREESPLVGVSA